MIRIALLIAFVTFLLAGCVTVPRGAGSIELTIARGPCFGYCPVFEIRTIGRDHVRFEGLRHTASLGVTIKQADRAAISDIVSALAPYRPAGAYSKFPCDEEVSDQALYTINWRESANGEARVLTFNSGCRSASGRVLRAILEAAPDKLGLASESRQVTRPGISRG